MPGMAPVYSNMAQQQHQQYVTDRYGNVPSNLIMPTAVPYQHIGGWRAPVLEPRNILLSDYIPPPQAYHYPTTGLSDPLAEVAPSKEETLQAMAEWYVDQVIDVLACPGSFRAGVGGSEEEVWGLRGRERAAWERVGRAAPDYSKPWGRMGMTATPAQPIRKLRSSRSPEKEAYDPWNVLWCNTPTRSTSLVHFVKDVLARMSVEHTSIVAATWFLSGLGLHDGDGAKGSQIRAFLRAQRSTEIEAVEKRVAMLGLLLAGKWLDDNSFLNKSWTEVTSIPVDQVHMLEVAALQDHHWALYIPLSSWVDHVNKLYFATLCEAEPSRHHSIVCTTLDEMVSLAREAEVNGSELSALLDGRRSSRDLAADQALSRDWGSFVRSYAINELGQTVDDDYELNRHVSALVESEMFSVDEEGEEMEMEMEMKAEDEEEDEWELDYDGAKRWLPPISEMRRSTSGSQSPARLGENEQYNETIPHWNARDDLDRSDSFDMGYGLATPAAAAAAAAPPLVLAATSAVHVGPAQHGRSPYGEYVDRNKMERAWSATVDQEHATLSTTQYAYPTPPQVSPVRSKSKSKSHQRQRSSMELEPGIAIIRAPPHRQSSQHQYEHEHLQEDSHVEARARAQAQAQAEAQARARAQAAHCPTPHELQMREAYQRDLMWASRCFPFYRY